MSFSLPEEIAAGTVWMTESGYPAIISEVEASKNFGLVVSPSGVISCSWNETGKNFMDMPSFFDLKYPPDYISQKYAIIKNGALIGSASCDKDAKEMGSQNNADLICKYSELIKYVSN